MKDENFFFFDWEFLLFTGLLLGCLVKYDKRDFQALVVYTVADKMSLLYTHNVEGPKDYIEQDKKSYLFLRPFTLSSSTELQTFSVDNQIFGR